MGAAHVKSHRDRAPSSKRRTEASFVLSGPKKRSGFSRDDAAVNPQIHRSNAPGTLRCTEIQQVLSAVHKRNEILLSINSALYRQFAFQLHFRVVHSYRERAMHPALSDKFFLGRGTSQYGGDGLPAVSSTGDFGFESKILFQAYPEAVPEGRLTVSRCV